MMTVCFFRKKEERTRRVGVGSISIRRGSGQSFYDSLLTRKSCRNRQLASTKPIMRNSLTSSRRAAKLFLRNQWQFLQRAV
jgi:hypothetical protein